MVIIIMGVSGSGKTTIGSLLSSKLNIPFFDADDFHSKINISKMADGHSLTDQDREPWLKTLSEKIGEWNIDGDAVLACSALKEKYRVLLASKSKNIEWFFLSGSQEEITKRLEQRENHYMKPNLLQSQFDTLEDPINAHKLDISQSPEFITHEIIKTIKN